MSETTPVLRQSSMLATSEFVRLIWSVMHRANINCSELSRKSGFSKTKLSRGLSGRATLDFPSIQQLFDVLGIDTQRALLAIGHLGDWNRYYDPDVEVLANLIEQLPETMAAARGGCERVSISAGGIKRLADHISAVIADNDRKVSDRRDAFLLEVDLRRAG